MCMKHPLCKAQLVSIEHFTTPPITFVDASGVLGKVSAVCASYFMGANVVKTIKNKKISSKCLELKKIDYLCSPFLQRDCS